jgi:hypothetical protein
MLRKGHLAHRGGERNTCGVFVGRPERNETLETHWRKYEENIKMGLKVVGWDDVEWNNPAYFWEMWGPLVPKTLSFFYSIKLGKCFDFSEVL